MKTLDEKTIERINQFIDEYEISPLENYNVLHYSTNYIVLKTVGCEIKIYIVGEKSYVETIPIYPVFNLREIEEAIIYRQQQKEV